MSLPSVIHSRVGREEQSVTVESIEREMERLSISNDCRTPLRNTQTRPKLFSPSTASSATSSTSSSSADSVFDQDEINQGTDTPIGTPPDKSERSPSENSWLYRKGDLESAELVSESSRRERMNTDDDPRSTVTLTTGSENKRPGFKDELNPLTQKRSRGRRISSASTQKLQALNSSSKDALNVPVSSNTRHRTTSAPEIISSSLPETRRRNIRKAIAAVDAKPSVASLTSEEKNSELLNSEEKLPSASTTANTKATSPEHPRELPPLEIVYLPGQFPQDTSPVLNSNIPVVVAPSPVESEKLSINQTRATPSPYSGSSRRKKSSSVQPSAVEAELPELYFVSYGAINNDNQRNTRICEEIRKDVNMKKGIPMGRIYIYSSKLAKEHVKIGKTESSSPKRLKRWKNNCKLPVELHEDEFTDSFAFFNVVERLAHIELHNQRKKYACKACTEKAAKEKANMAVKNAAQQTGNSNAGNKVATLTPDRGSCSDALQQGDTSAQTSASDRDDELTQSNEIIEDYHDDDFDDDDDDDDDVEDDPSKSHEMVNQADTDEPEVDLSQCSNGTSTAIPKSVGNFHTEWFKVDPATAQKTVAKWRNWLIDHRPFNNCGKLTHYWIWRVEKIKGSESLVDWDSWTQPSKLDHCLYLYECHVIPALSLFASQRSRVWVTVLAAGWILHIFRGFLSAVLVIFLIFLGSVLNDHHKEASGKKKSQQQ